jgi:hypothetical protein
VQYIVTGHITVDVEGNGAVEMLSPRVGLIPIREDSLHTQWVMNLGYAAGYIFTIVPDDGYRIYSVSLDGAPVTLTGAENNQFTINPVVSRTYRLNVEFVEIIGEFAIDVEVYTPQVNANEYVVASEQATWWEVMHVRGGATNTANLVWTPAPGWIVYGSGPDWTTVTPGLVDLNALTADVLVIRFTPANATDTRTMDVQYLAVGRVTVNLGANGSLAAVYGTSIPEMLAPGTRTHFVMPEARTFEVTAADGYTLDTAALPPGAQVTPGAGGVYDVVLTFTSNQYTVNISFIPDPNADIDLDEVCPSVESITFNGGGSFFSVEENINVNLGNVSAELNRNGSWVLTVTDADEEEIAVSIAVASDAPYTRTVTIVPVSPI